MENDFFLPRAHDFFQNGYFDKALDCYMKFVENCPELAHLVNINVAFCRKKTNKIAIDDVITINVPIYDNSNYAIKCYNRIFVSLKHNLNFEIINGYAEQSYLIASISVGDVIGNSKIDCLDRESVLRMFFQQAGLFEDKFYRSQYKLRDGIDALEHYLREGFSKGYLPSSWFDVGLGDNSKSTALRKQMQEKIIKDDSIPKISVLVPVYNNAKFLSECLDSIVNQTLKGIEIIIINDGSTDPDSIKIMEDYASENSRIRLIHKKNTGYGHSINCGLYAAKGEYIGIVESDDFINTKMYEMLYDIVKKYKVDCVKADSVQFWYDNGEKKEKYVPSRRNLNEYDVVIDPLKNKTAFDFSITCSGIYKKDVINKYNIYYNETPGSSYQDISFSFAMTCHAASVFYINKPCYYYRQDNELSSIHRKDNVYMAYCQYKYVHDRLMVYQEKYAIFSKVLFYRMFHSFVYTYNRVGIKFKKEFILFFAKTFNELITAKKIDLALFRQDEQSLLNQVVTDPIEYYKKTSQLTIAFATNNKYAKHLWCAISSLLDVCSQEESYNIAILYFELSEDNKRMLMSLADGNASISILCCTDHMSCLDLYEVEHYSKEMYLRLLIPEIFKNEERVVYFDCDMIFRQDVSELFYLDVDTSLGVVKNYCNKNVSNYIKNELNIDVSKYFNSGFLLFNVKRFNEKDIYKQFLSFIRSGKKFKMPDQDVLNLVCQGDVTFLDPRWNFQWHNLIHNKVDEFSASDRDEYLSASNNPFVVHYTSSTKPWFEKNHRFSEYYSTYEDKYDNLKKADSNMKYKISVVIPVYNEEKLLHQALESVLAQSISCEIICIDDGSTDNSIDILKKYAELYENIVLIQQGNLGAGAARNKGLAVAQGEFIYFLDADDYCPDSNVLEILYKKAKEHGTMICGGSLCYDCNGRIVLPKEDEFFFSNEKLEKYDNVQYDYAYQRYIYNLDFIRMENFEFPNYLRFQDPVFFVKIMHAAEYFYCIKHTSYCYRKKNTKINWTERKVNDLVCGLRDNIKFAKENNLNILYARSLIRVKREYRNIIEQYIKDININNVIKEIELLTNEDLNYSV